MPLLTEPVTKVVWEPLPGSQTLALDSRADVTLYHGTRGPGKTEAEMMAFRKHVGIGYGRFWRGIVIDREYKHLDDILDKMKRVYNAFDDGVRFLGGNEYKWLWPTGEELLLRAVYDERDYSNYHGHEYPFIAWNELTKWPNLKAFDLMMSCNRSSWTQEKNSPKDKNGKYLLPPIPLKTFATTNSEGIGHSQVKMRFIDPAPSGTVVRTVFKDVPDPQQNGKLVDITRTQIAIFGSFRENKYLSATYIAGLMQLCENNDNLRKSWLEGSWDVVSGGAIDDLWKPAIHILPTFQVPIDWYVDRSLDWGSSHPASVGWWAEANGEEATLPDGKIFCPEKGSLIQCGELYLSKGIGTNEGLRMSAPDVAQMVINAEVRMLADKLLQRQPRPGPADNQIRDVRESDVDTIEKKMADKGVRWQESDKSPGSRRNGLQLLRDRLQAAVKHEGPAIYFMAHCRASIATLPILPRDPIKQDDVDTTSEDHPYDQVRYRVLKGANRLANKANFSFTYY